MTDKQRCLPVPDRGQAQDAAGRNSGGQEVPAEQRKNIERRARKTSTGCRVGDGAGFDGRRRNTSHRDRC